MNSININGGGVDIKVSVFLFKEGEVHIAYCPSLDISGYDATEELARRDFEWMLSDWLREQVAAGTLADDLAAHGWRVSGGGAMRHVMR